VRRTSRLVQASACVVALLGVLIAPSVSYATLRASAPLSVAAAHVASSCGVAPSATLRIVAQREPCTLDVKLGSSFVVVLDPGFRWAAPISSSNSLKVTRVTRSSSNRMSVTVAALALGRGTLTSEGAMICPAGQACPALARLWMLHVVVVRSLATTKVVTVTQLDNGRHVALHVGDELVLRLVGPSNYAWTTPVSSNAAVLRVLRAVRGSTASASLVAIAPGVARATSIDTARCYPQCLAPSRLFAVDVIVSP